MPANPAAARSRGSTGQKVLRSLLSGLRSPSRLVESARVLRDIQAGAGPGPEVQCVTLSYRPRGISRTGDLYRTGDALAGLVLVPGAARMGKDEPRLMAFAQALARARFEVLVPDLPGLKNLRVHADDADIISDSLSVLAQHRAAHGNATVGMIAISYSTGPAMIALLDERVRGAAQFMLSIGGYCDIEAVIAFITTGSYRGPFEDVPRFRAPDEYGKWVFACSNAMLLEDGRDRELLESMAQRRLADNTADISDLAAGLGDDGRKIFAVLENRDPERVSGLIAALPRHIFENIANLDLKRRDFSELDMHFVLIHGHDDAVIPETESIALAGALPGSDLYILNSMQHVDPGPARLADALKMLAAMLALLRERDTARPTRAMPAKSPLRFPAGSRGAG